MIYIINYKRNTNNQAIKSVAKDNISKHMKTVSLYKMNYRK